MENENEEKVHRIICGDNLEVLTRFPRNSVDFCADSPPYASQRKKHYTSISEKDYPEFTLRWMSAVERVLKPHGSVAIVIRSHMRDGAVRPYVLRTRLNLIDNGWYECEEMVWHKPDAFPTGRRDRPRRSHENILWYSRNPKIAFCDPKANGKVTEAKNMWMLTGGYDGNGKGFRSGVGAPEKYKGDMHGSREVHQPKGTIARSTDVLRSPVSGCSRSKYNHHPAQHPVDLYRQLIRLFCPLGGTVLDPFGGSGTTMEASFLEGRNSISIDNKQEYVDIMRRRLMRLEIAAQAAKKIG